MNKFFLFALSLLLTSTLYSADKIWKCIDEDGNVKFSIETKYVYEFSDGMARIQEKKVVNNKWESSYGYLNTEGKIVIPCNYDKVNDFVNGRAWVKKKGESKYTLINKQGIEIPTAGYEKVGYIMEGYSDRIAVYNSTGAMGFIDRDGKEVIPCKYLGSSTFDPEFGLACVTLYSGTEEKYGFINKSGAVIIPFQFKQSGTTSFHNGMCRASVNGKTVMINNKGEVIFTSKHGSVQNINKGLMAIPTKPNRSGWGFVNLKDEMVVPAEYDNAISFNVDGYAIVEKNGLNGLVDTTGKVVLPIKYETIYCDFTEDGYICGVLPTDEPSSLLKTPKEYFDKDLNPLDMKGNTLMSADGSNRIQYMTPDAKRGFMDLDYNIVIPAKYSKATKFNDGLAFVVD